MKLSQLHCVFFREANSGLPKYFLQRHRLHQFQVGLYGAPCSEIFQESLNKSEFKITWTVLI